MSVVESIELLAQDDPKRMTKAKACRVCNASFLPFMTTQSVCSVRCARRVPVLSRKAAKDDRKKTRERIDALRPLGYWVKQAQQAFNAWIRLRDADLPCISCQATVAKQWHAGHYLTTGARPELRFDEMNAGKQCSQCNDHLSGNLVLYRLGLIERIGIANVERLEGPHPPKRYRIDDLKAIRDDYRTRAKALRTGAVHQS